MKAGTLDRLGSILMLAFVAVLWVQRDYMTPFGGIFPDIVMEIMAGILVVTLILSFTPYAAMKEAGEKKGEGGRKTNWKDMAVVGGILLAWAVLLRFLGFALSGIVGFGSISWYLGGMRRDVKDAGRCLLIGVAIVILMVVVFQRLLDVPLPVGKIFE